MKIKICENCYKEFKIINPYARNQIYCSEKCKREMTRSMSKDYRVKVKLKQPKISVDTVARFQNKYKEETGKWISYTEACKILEEKE